MPTKQGNATESTQRTKICPICKKSKSITRAYYASSSPLHQRDHRVPICIKCIKDSVLNGDGSINNEKFKNMMQRLDKPLYWDDLNSAYAQCRKKRGFSEKKDVSRFGNQVLGLYFKTTMLKQNVDKHYGDSEREGFYHNNNIAKDAIELEEKCEQIVFKQAQNESPIYQKKDDFKVTEEMINLFGEGYTKTEYRKMSQKYEEMKKTYVIQTSIHKEALVTYVRFKVKEEIATAKGDVADAQKWYSAAQTAAEQGKLTAKQISKEDLQGGIVNFSDIFTAVEGAKERIKIFPEFKYQPKDAADFIIWCYINYERNLNNLPEVEYSDVYAFYDKKKKEYVDTYGDPYGIFADDTTSENRLTIEKFITIPNEFKDGD